MGERLRLKTKGRDAKRKNSISNIRHAGLSRTLNPYVDEILYLQRTIDKGVKSALATYEVAFVEGRIWLDR